MWTNENREKCLDINKEKEFQKNILEKEWKKQRKMFRKRIFGRKAWKKE